MDYEEKYKQALAKAKEYQKFSVSIPEDMAMLEDIFPELKESEDERIRKAIINFLHEGNPFKDIKKETRQRWIAWLEKQGECHISHDDEIMIEQLTEYFTTGHGLQNTNETVVAWLNDVKEKLEKQAEHKKFRDSIQVGDKVTKNEDGVLVNLSQLKRVAKKDEQILANSAKTCKDEQKPASFEIPLLEKFKQAVYDCAWGKVTCKSEGETQDEYVERWTEQLLSIVRDWADDYIDYTIQQKLRKSYDKGKEDAIKENSSAWSEEDETVLDNLIYALANDRIGNDRDEYVDWLKSLKDRVHLQPKPEWSDEDERIIDRLCDILYDCHSYGECSLKLNEYSNLYDWLKSLRPQNRWKPDKAVIQILELIIQGKANPTNYQATLMNLVEQLKKLK